MHSSSLLLVLSAVGNVLARPSALPRDVAADTESTGSRKFIIEAQKSQNVQALVTQLSGRPGVKILKTFSTDVFTGVSIEANQDNLDSLRSLTKASNAWMSKTIPLADHKPFQTFEANITATNYSVHSLTGVDKLHAKGITGKGATVAIIDTGIWYPHPALGGGFGPGFKVAGGYDLVGDNGWPNSPKAPDSDPLDQIGHGTHVAGILAGKTDFWQGVAPDATLLSYKVFSDVDSTDEDTLIDAFLQAYDAGADVITASVGGDGGFSTDAWATVASRIAETGVIVTIAAGNDGQNGPFWPSNGASGEFVVAVASMDPSIVPANPYAITFTNKDGNSDTTTAAYLPFQGIPWPSTVKDLPVWVASFNTTDASQACSPLPDNTPDLSNVVVVVLDADGYSCTTDEKRANLAAKGAQYILFYEYPDYTFTAPFTLQSNTTLGEIEYSAGVSIVEAITKGINITVDFSQNYPGVVGAYYSSGGVPSYFTSYGALFDLTLKPDITAPGGTIWSTYLNDQYAIMSGTSMATPYVAGVAALYVSQTGGRKVRGANFAKDFLDQVISSGDTLPYQSYLLSFPGYNATVDQVGNGLIRADKLLTYDTTLTFDKFSLNDTHHFSRYHSVDITNNGKTAVTYTFSLEPAAGYDALVRPNYDILDRAIFGPEIIVPKVSFPTGKFVVQPGQTKVANINFDIPDGLDAQLLPVYSGKVAITGSNSESLSVPYFGVGTDLHSLWTTTFVEEQFLPQINSLPPLTSITNNPNVTFNSDPNNLHYVSIGFGLRWGADEVRLDIFDNTWVERDWEYPLVPGKNGYISSVSAYQAAFGSEFDPTQADPSSQVPFPLGELPRNLPIFPTLTRYQFYWTGTLANGSTIQPGKYQIRMGVLAPFGTPEHSNNWGTFGPYEINILSS